MDRGLLAAHWRVVEARQVVVDERGAVQKFDRRGGRLGGGGVIVAAGERDGEAEPRADAVAAGEDCVADRLRQQRRRTRRLRMRNRIVEHRLDPPADVHAVLPLSG
ncbi:hypothetical protein M2440_004047 [Methylorubrum extorquens]|nr:hypothetical protein [Methylorubrum extorquens]